MNNKNLVKKWTIKEEIRSTIEHFFHAMDSQNLTLQQLIPHNESTIHIGTDKGEIWKGWKILNEAIKDQFEGLEYYKATIRDLTINIADCRNVAWYFHLLDGEIKSNKNITHLQGARFTGVLKKKGEHWTLTQTHVSVPDSE